MKNYITILAVIAVTFLTSCNIDSKNEYTPQISTSYFLKYKIDNGEIKTKSDNEADQEADTLDVTPTTDAYAWTIDPIISDGTSSEDIYFSLGFNAFTNDLISLKVEVSDSNVVKLKYREDSQKLKWKDPESVGKACLSIDTDAQKYNLKFKPGFNYGTIPVLYQIQPLPDNKDEETFSITITLESDSRYSPAKLKLQQTVKKQQQP